MSNTNPNKNTRFKVGRDASEKGKRGGIASGESKRISASLKDIITETLTDEDMIEIAHSLSELAKKGSTRAFSAIRDTLGEMPRRTIVLKENSHLSYKDGLNEVAGFLGISSEDLDEYINEC